MQHARLQCSFVNQHFSMNHTMNVTHTFNFSEKRKLQLASKPLVEDQHYGEDEGDNDFEPEVAKTTSKYIK